MSTSERYVAGTRDRRKPPKNRKRWYRCACGRWHGINKRYRCRCGRLPPSQPDDGVRFQDHAW